MGGSHSARCRARLGRAIALSLLLLGGCASTRVDQRQVSTSPEPLPKPERILVYDFAVSPDDVRLNQGPLARVQHLVRDTAPTDEELRVGREVAAALSEALVQRLGALGLPAERASGLQPTPDGTLRIEGQFLSIDEGNRARRMIIGFGLGNTEVKTLVQVSLGRAGESSVVQAFETTAEGSKMPGMAAMMGVGAAARGAAGLATAAGVSGGAHAADEWRASVEAEARRTAEALVTRLAQFFAAQGWVPPEAVP
jgi:hypothetical protein